MLQIAYLKLQEINHSRGLQTDPVSKQDNNCATSNIILCRNNMTTVNLLQISIQKYPLRFLEKWSWFKFVI